MHCRYVCLYTPVHWSFDFAAPSSHMRSPSLSRGSRRGWSQQGSREQHGPKWDGEGTPDGACQPDANARFPRARGALLRNSVHPIYRQVLLLGLQIAQSRPHLYTLGLKVGTIYLLGAPGYVGRHHGCCYMF